MANSVNRTWQLKNPELDPASMPGISGLTPLTIQLLYQRGITDPTSIHRFLKPDLNQLVDPFKISGITDAVRRINQAIQRQEKITVYGDYDVDGIIGVVLVMKLFKLLDYSVVDYYIPHRLEEGYGLNANAIDKLAKNGTKLIITVDCGTSAVTEVKHARELGIDVVITDHHEPAFAEAAEGKPDAIALINPRLSNAEPFIRDLSGAGVAFKLCWALLHSLPQNQRLTKAFQNFLIDAMTLVAIGTVADVVPLIGENRVLVYYGLQSVPHSRITGLKELMIVSRVKEAELKPYQIAFRLAPRLNAGGRLTHAGQCVDLLMSESEPHCRQIAEDLEKANRERQKIEARILDEARQQLTVAPKLAKQPVLVLSAEGWHPGVIGIVASRIAEEFSRPTIIISRNGIISKGSGRSVPGFHLYNALNNCRHLFSSFGGHAMAAGLELKTENIPQLINHLQSSVLGSEVRPVCAPGPAPLMIDAEVAFTDLSRQMLREIEMLAPFGEGNPEPILATKGLRLAGQPQFLGKNSEHLSFVVTTTGKKSFRVIAFWQAAQNLARIESVGKGTFSLAYTPRLNRWQGNETVELEFKDIRPDQT